MLLIEEEEEEEEWRDSMDEGPVGVVRKRRDGREGDILCSGAWMVSFGGEEEMVGDVFMMGERWVFCTSCFIEKIY